MGNKYNRKIRDNLFYDSFASFPPATESDTEKLYIDELNGIIYRNSGTEYIQVSSFGGLNYKGSWDATNNVPELVSSTGTQGDFYLVSVAGNTNLDGETNWNIDDQVLFNGSIWQRIPSTNISNIPVELAGTNTITEVDTIYLVNALTSDAVITIPDADITNGGRNIQIIKKSGDYNVIVQTVSSQLIGGQLTQTIFRDNKGFTVTSMGSGGAWIITQDSRTSLDIKTINSTYTVEAKDNTLLADGTFTITLPTNLYDGFLCTIKNIGTGVLTLSSTVNIDDTTTKTLNVQYDSYSLQYDGTQWWIL